MPCSGSRVQRWLSELVVTLRCARSYLVNTLSELIQRRALRITETVGRTAKTTKPYTYWVHQTAREYLRPTGWGNLLHNERNAFTEDGRPDPRARRRHGLLDRRFDRWQQQQAPARQVPQGCPNIGKGEVREPATGPGLWQESIEGRVELVERNK